MIGRGERAPDFALPMGGAERPTRFYGLVGGAPSVLVFAGGDGPSGHALAAALERDLPSEHLVFHVARAHDELGARLVERYDQAMTKTRPNRPATST